MVSCASTCTDWLFHTPETSHKASDECACTISRKLWGTWVKPGDVWWSQGVFKWLFPKLLLLLDTTEQLISHQLDCLVHRLKWTPPANSRKDNKGLIGTGFAVVTYKKALRSERVPQLLGDILDSNALFNLGGLPSSRCKGFARKPLLSRL